jgi:predicted nucleic acid-binding Zn ribbon protein
VTRRRAPSPAEKAFRAARSAAAPVTPLAAVQDAWSEIVGDGISAVAEPVAERGGTVFVACRDAVWAQELDLLQADLIARLRQRLGPLAPGALRFRVEGVPGS